MDLQKALDQLGKGVKQIKPDRYRARPINLTFNPEGIELFNKVYMLLYRSHLATMKRTSKGVICTDFKNNNTWDCIQSKAAIEITVYYLKYLYVWRIGRPMLEDHISGWKAFRLFSDKCKEYGIDLEQYKIPNGKEIKETIEKPLIFFKNYDKVYKRVNHIDFHNSYPAGLVRTHPEFKEVVQYFYERRKEDPTNKMVLNATIGYMQSLQCCDAAWSYLSRDAIKDNNDRIRELATRIALSGRYILGYNTDGIWYQGDPYKGEGEGKELGEWENDHINCQLRAKSNGAYEYIEDGKYTPVLRGFTNYDNIKPREQWVWGDIYRTDCEILTYTFEIGKGVIVNEEEKNNLERTF